jgi:hypothetical protein
VFNWIARQPLKRSWFFEERNGNCRLMADLVSQLAETASTWARLVAPLAEWAVKEIASTTKMRRQPPATRLTQNCKRALTGGTFVSKAERSVRPPNMCSACGNEIHAATKKCNHCALEDSTEQLRRAASEGRAASHTSEAEAKRSKTRQTNAATLREWSASDQPSWLTEAFYTEKMQPLLAPMSSRAIARQLAVSRGYATEIRHGRVPHPRHWLTLARLTALSE